MKRKTIKASHDDIVDYWSSRISETDLSVDFSEASERCWRCGYECKLERCHIIPHSLGGLDTPDNLVLLCHRCHLEGPNINDADFFWDWLKAHKAEFYDTYWMVCGFREYEFIYKESVETAMIRVNATAEEFRSFLNCNKNIATTHFGMMHYNPATYAGILRKFITSKENNFN